MVDGILSVDGRVDICEACIHGKQRRFPFPPSNKRAHHKLDIVHSDVCGPLPLSITGKKYFITFTDYHTHHTWLLSWSVLGHVLSEEQSKDGSDGVSDDGRLTIVQCHHYHRPPSSDLYRSSIGILPPLCYHQNNLHSYHCHYQPTPCAFYRSTTTAPPCSTHVPCSRPITSRTHQSQGHESRSPQGPTRIYVGILQHHPEYESPCYMFILLPYALHDNSLYVYVLLQYKYSSLLYVFR